jgi:hypothetical protein
MAAARDTVAKNIKPLQGAKVRRYTAGATISPGELVAMATSGKLSPAITTTITLAKVVGVALGVGDLADGDPIDVVTEGPVLCLTGATIGATIYATDVAGEPGEAAGTKSSVAGFAETATILYVRPFQTVFA